MRRLILPAALLATLAPAATAVAGTNAAKFDLGFTTKKVKKSTGFSFNVVFANTDNPAPSPLKKFSVALPKGSKFNTLATNPCIITAIQLEQQGTKVCAPGSKVGTGQVQAVPAGGGNTIKAKATIFSLPGNGFLFGISVNGSEVSKFIADAKGNKLTSETLTGQLPGGITVTSLKGSIKAKSSKGKNLVTTPKTCPKSGKWTFKGTFSFKDGTDKPTDQVACKS